MMALRATAEKAMFCADNRLLAAITTALASSVGASSAQSRACIPPNEPPTQESNRSIPRWRISRRCTVTKSRIDSNGKSRP